MTYPSKWEKIQTTKTNKQINKGGTMKHTEGIYQRV